jgi:hypothetical protein
MINIVKIDDLDQVVATAIQKVYNAVALARAAGNFQVELPEKLDFSMNVVSGWQVLESQSSESGGSKETGGYIDNSSSNENGTINDNGTTNTDETQTSNETQNTESNDTTEENSTKTDNTNEVYSENGTEVIDDYEY